MKFRTVIFLVLACGASSVLTFLVRQQRPQETTVASSNVTPPSPVVVTTAVNREVVVTNTIDWSKVESADYLVYIQNLRTIGCPRQTVADIIVADVNKLFLSRARQIFQGTNALPKYEYWKTAKEQEVRGRKKAELKTQVAGLERERIALIKRLLGSDVSADQLAPLHYPIDSGDDKYAMDFLSPEKQLALKQIDAEMDVETRMRIKPGSQDASGLRELERLRLEREAKMKQVMTPEEWLDYTVRFSQTANHLRADLEGLNPTENEFKHIVALKKQLDDQFSPLVAPTNADEIKARSNAEAAYLANLRQTLGDERYADYQRAMDPNYQFLRSTFQNSTIPTEQLNSVYNLWSAAQSEADKVRNDGNLSAEERLARLREISAGAQTQIQTQIGNGPGSEVLAVQGSKIFGRIETLTPPRRSMSRGGTAVFYK